MEMAMVALSCILFVSMGLAQAIQDYIPFRLRVLTCPKCLTFWSVLAYNLITGQGVIRSIAVSFITAYIALWAALALDILTLLYNWIYEKITRNQSTAEAEGSDTRSDKQRSEADTPDALP